MTYDTLAEISDGSERYIGRVISKPRFLLGDVFFLEVENRYSGKTHKIKLAKSGIYGTGMGMHIHDGWAPVFRNINFSEKGLEISVQMVDTLIGASPARTLIIPKDKFPQSRQLVAA